MSDGDRGGEQSRGGEAVALLRGSFRRARLRLLDQFRQYNAPKAMLAAVSLPLALSPRALAIRVCDRYLRFNANAWLAPSVYRRAIAAARPVRTTDRLQQLHRSIILKVPGRGGEHGFLLTSFEAELDKLATSPHLGRIEASYDICFVPTWQPFYTVPLYRFLARASRPIMLMPSSRPDYQLCTRRHLDLVALPFQASSWVNPQFFQPSSRKDIDLIMLANFSAYKRHWHLFRALRDLPTDLRVVLVGVPIDTRTPEALLDEARLFGVADRVKIVETPSDDVVSSLLARARLFLALSAKEGSCIAVAEALFAGTPVAIYKDAVIGSKEYVNPKTGVLLDRSRPLAAQIMEVLERTDDFAPAEWARREIGSAVNSARLNQQVRKLTTERGAPWTRDLVAFYCRHFDFFYHDATAEDEFAAEYGRFRETFGIEIVRSA